MLSEVILLTNETVLKGSNLFNYIYWYFYSNRLLYNLNLIWCKINTIQFNLLEYYNVIMYIHTL